MDTALDPLADGVARGAGAIRTRAVTGRTTLLPVRYRFDLETTTGTESRIELCECGGVVPKSATEGGDLVCA